MRARWCRWAGALLLAGLGVFTSGCGPRVRERPGAVALEDVRLTLVHLQGVRIGGPADERLELLADAVGAITTLPRANAVLLGPTLFAWPTDLTPEGLQATLELTGSVLSILAPPVRPVLDAIDLGGPAHAEEVLRFFERRKAIALRSARYALDLAPGAHLLVLGAAVGAEPSGAEQSAAWLRRAFARTDAPVLIVAAPREPEAAALRAVIAAERRVRCIVCAEARPAGRPAHWPPVLVSPPLADTQRFRVIEIGAGLLMSWTRGLFEGAPADRFTAPLAPAGAEATRGEERSEARQ